jgi:DNA-binding transcriptional regulator YiaG
MNPVIDSLREEAVLRRSLPSPATRRALREEAGIPRRRIAEVVGVTVGAVTHWESGARRPSSEHLRRYLEVLDALRGSSSGMPPP